MLLLMTSDRVPDVYPCFESEGAESFTQLVEIESKVLGRRRHEAYARSDDRHGTAGRVDPSAQRDDDAVAVGAQADEPAGLSHDRVRRPRLEPPTAASPSGLRKEMPIGDRRLKLVRSEPRPGLGGHEWPESTAS